MYLVVRVGVGGVAAVVKHILAGGVHHLGTVDGRGEGETGQVHLGTFGSPRGGDVAAGTGCFRAGSVQLRRTFDT